MRQSILAALAAALLWTALAVLSLPPEAMGAAAPAGAAIGRPPEAASETAASDRAGAAIGRPPEASAFDSAGFDEHLLLPVLTDGQVVSMDLHTYITGVLLAEMPLSFAEEALKAQTVASRTYALRSLERPRHENAAVCTDSRCCQGWRDPAAADPEERARAEAAVRATDGLAVYYRNDLIDATFFACSGGRTEDAAAVWGGDLPYLRAVDSPGEEGAAHFTDETRVPLEAFQDALRELDGDVVFPEALGAWVDSVSYTAGGGVDVLVLGGRPFRGTQLRKRFGLRSTAFTLELTAEEAVFSTRGNGHRVGMSQYGAEAMARNGADFREILTWYYQGTEVRAAEENGNGG